MNQTGTATKQDVSELREDTKQGMSDLRKEMKQNTASLRKEMKQTVREAVDEIGQVIDVALTRIDERFSKVESKLDLHSDDIRQILNRLDHIEKQLEITEQERLVMGHQLERLDMWVHELAKKIGYKLSA